MVGDMSFQGISASSLVSRKIGFMARATTIASQRFSISFAFIRGSGLGSIALAASHCPTPRDFVPWRFSAADRLAAG